LRHRKILAKSLEGIVVDSFGQKYSRRKKESGAAKEPISG
jgi:hypothetical protein